ncbi:hypothetical protein RPHASCH2410_CH17935 [Rhizobium phaseoli Ch24-10]|nr:hypothetical protein RPHASCH2410_CH17935 [Rhizobium phaseoli Ch24-10]
MHQEQRNDKALTHFCGSSGRMTGFSSSSRATRLSICRKIPIAGNARGHKKTASGKEAAWS